MDPCCNWGQRYITAQGINKKEDQLDNAVEFTMLILIQP